MPIDKMPVVTVKLTIAPKWARRQNFSMFGRPIASRWKRDAEVALGDGVTVLSGGFGLSGGSRQYPAIDPEEGTVLLVRDVVYTAAREAMVEDPEYVSILSREEENRRLLEDEASSLKEKLARIEKVLSQMPPLGAEDNNKERSHVH
ncbi:hypothetical protein [Geoalkalibacter subterraneus]|uniref:Uncharacterized protein n=1 Tax=Geoalkalibacter subterraneus TaxID=483547 RepID=A0A0B5FLI8_9BACT|nr:hypothetical protein [Geoalkalibacter subterraneus]AJF08308.1 hypothetical protein GSUB_17710 [Geoalkalibacter subterraneus]